MDNIDILNELDRQETTYNGIFLGCAIKNKKNAEDKPENKYGLISLYFTGVNSKNENWYSVQEQYLSVDDMKNIVGDIPFGTKVKATYSVGNTPGGRQRISKLEIIK